MNTALWIVQILLALAFGMTGFMKVRPTREKLATSMGYFSPNIVRTIGVLELSAAVGLILPALTGILPVLTPLAALGLVLTMIGAMLTHLRYGQRRMIATNLVLLALAAFVAYGRFVAVPL